MEELSNAKNIADISIFLTLVWVLSGGALGGLCDFLNRFQIGNSKEGKKKEPHDVSFQGIKIKLPHMIPFCLMNMILGIGGAVAILFTMISVGKFPQVATVEAQLLLFSISVVAGFGGRRFLELVTNSLEKQIGEAKEASDKAVKVSERAVYESMALKDELKIEAEETIATSTSLATLREGSILSDRVDAIKKNEQILAKRPNNRALTILTGRLYRRNDNYEHGIETLTRYIRLKRELGERDEDLAAALYNRACYRVLLASEDGVPIQRLREQGLEDLKESVSLDLENAKDAKEDPDFNSVKDNPVFQEIMGEE